MKELNLPIIKVGAPKHKVLSMDDYLKFVEFNLKNTFDEKASAKWKRLSAVNVPFVMW